jgi:tetratricopeptide (TPR) repeat protein
VRIYPLMAEAYYNLGSSCFRICRIAKAAAAFRNAIRYSSDDDGIEAKARERLARMEQILTRDSPLATLDEYIENENLFGRAFECLKARRYDEGIELFNQVLKQNPRSVQSYGNMGLAYAGLGKKARALECLDKALELDPSYEPARNNRLAVLAMSEGKPLRGAIFGETGYYRDKLEAKKAGTGSWLDRMKIWRRA